MLAGLGCGAVGLWLLSIVVGCCQWLITDDQCQITNCKCSLVHWLSARGGGGKKSNRTGRGGN